MCIILCIDRPSPPQRLVTKMAQFVVSFGSKQSEWMHLKYRLIIEVVASNVLFCLSRKRSYRVEVQVIAVSILAISAANKMSTPTSPRLFFFHVGWVGRWHDRYPFESPVIRVLEGLEVIPSELLSAEVLVLPGSDSWTPSCTVIATLQVKYRIHCYGKIMMVMVMLTVVVDSERFFHCVLK